MARLPGLDPEVLADLRLREQSERDPSRSRVDPTAWTEPAIVEHWPCRGGCGTMVGVTREAIDALASSNAMLARRREAPIAKTKVVWCPPCKRRDDELAAMQREARRPMRQTEPPGTSPARSKR
jgi:hypothetical protein